MGEALAAVNNVIDRSKEDNKEDTSNITNILDYKSKNTFDDFIIYKTN